MIKKRKIYIAGHGGMVGSSLVKYLSKNRDVDIIMKCRDELDLTVQQEVRDFFNKNKIDEVYLVAAKVGGIYANNTYPADFIYNNLMIEANVINFAFESGVKKILFLGSSCIYPKLSKQPIKESNLLDGYLEPTNEPYAIAKIAGIKLCESYNRQYGVDYRCIMSTNIYGPGDNYHQENAHVVPALIKKFHDAKIENKPFVTIWGSGQPKRELIFVDDLADACIHVMNYDLEGFRNCVSDMNSHINIGTGKDITISDLAKLIAHIIEYNGEIRYDKLMPDGTMQKLLDVSLINRIGWKAKTDLVSGLKITYSEFLENL